MWEKRVEIKRNIEWYNETIQMIRMNIAERRRDVSRQRGVGEGGGVVWIVKTTTYLREHYNQVSCQYSSRARQLA